MGTIQRFEDIEAWQLAREIAKETYMISRTGEFAKDTRLGHQINDSIRSVMDNIAEGYGRGGKREFIQFLSISKASAGEFRSQLYLCLDREHITQEQFDHLYHKIIQVNAMLTNFMEYLKKSEIQGPKYKKN